MHFVTPYTEDYRHDETQFDSNWQTPTRVPREDYRRYGAENGFPVEYPPRGEVYHRDESMQTLHREGNRGNGVVFSPKLSAQPPPASGRLYQTARRPSSNLVRCTYVHINNSLLLPRMSLSFDITHRYCTVTTRQVCGCRISLKDLNEVASMRGWPWTDWERYCRWYSKISCKQ